MSPTPPPPSGFTLTVVPGQFRLAVNMPDAASLLDEVRRRLEAGEGFALATVNLDHLVKLRAEGPFRTAYAAQDLVVADGNPIVWLSKLAGRPVDVGAGFGHGACRWPAWPPKPARP